MFLSRAAKRACCLDSRLLPPTFLLPFTANLSSVSHTTSPSTTPDVLLNSSAAKVDTAPKATTPPTTSSNAGAAAAQSAPKLPTPAQSPPALSDSVRDLLPALQAQGPHYITAHIYDRPYLLTQGDTLRVPFLMHGVQPGDILRLTHASSLGSRDLTLKAGNDPSTSRSATTTTISVTDPTPTSTLSSESRVMPDSDAHFVPHLAKGKHVYIDDRLFVCRATVMGVEAEPMRLKEKTKRRQRKVKTVRSKHRFTVLKIKELRIKGLEEIESGVDA